MSDELPDMTNEAQLERLLSEALRPSDVERRVGAQLSARIVGATSGQAARADVLARVGRHWAWRAAAMVVLAGLLSLYVFSRSGSSAAQIDTQWAAVESELATLAAQTHPEFANVAANDPDMVLGLVGLELAQLTEELDALDQVMWDLAVEEWEETAYF